ncbi:MAG: glycerate kinase [Planctomycetia bacterium]
MTDAARIWSAAIAAVRPETLLAGLTLPLDDVDRIVVVGGGKAAAGMAAGVEAILGGDGLARHRVTGLVSVPEGCGRRLDRIEVRETRPLAANLPTPAVVEATEEMLAAIAQLGPHDLVIAVISGGGSALVAAPRPGITLEEKIAVTKQLSAAGASIAQLNAARREMSRVKGGGLARASGAGRLIAVVLSDVIGDDLDVISSGPCMPLEPGTAGSWTTPAGCRVEHRIVGSNATAVAAAAAAARSLGYEIVPTHEPREASAEATGRALAAEALRLVADAQRDGTPRAILSGGEATVVVPADHGRGGRNQQTVLAAIDGVLRGSGSWPEGLVIASVGTDGEDGPTDAAGACADARVARAITVSSLDVGRALARCDAYPLLDATGGLVRTGATGTNVADLRLVLIR